MRVNRKEKSERKLLELPLTLLIRHVYLLRKHRIVIVLLLLLIRPRSNRNLLTHLR